MTNHSPASADLPQNDTIYPLTRLVAALVIPFLLLAFLILYFFPARSGQWFAWEIKPQLTAMFMGAGYLGGALLFVQVVRGQRWHRAAAGFPAVTTFTVAMLLATILHWDRFQGSRLAFLLWTVLYLVTPFLVPWIWLRNRGADPGLPEPDDPRMPNVARWGLGLLGLFLLLFAVYGFVQPDSIAAIWTWNLSPLTARVMSGWFALMGVGGLVISRDTRWSAWRTGLISILVWQVLVLIAAGIKQQEFKDGNWLNWYVVSVAAVVVGMLALYLLMESRRRALGRFGPPPAAQ